MGKSSLLAIPADHFATLYDNRTGKLNPLDIAHHIGTPALIGTACWFYKVNLADATGAISGVSIVAGLLFSMAVFLFQLRTSLPKTPTADGLGRSYDTKRTESLAEQAGNKRISTSERDLIDECFSNVLWAILIGLFLAIYLIIGGAAKWFTHPNTGSIFTGIAIAISAHFLLTIAMCLKRLRRAYETIGCGMP
ncbi:hypothetical protein [uncultured Kocuria sp.]|uniref:hypothetical protein n=1 Tax=uncultured Kocuria sp. TaxID=259305 RepID=UPI00262DE338|nr:hypothetical protein [uncultured Kocuria sp.]